MADFLSRLTARTLGVANVVQPRIAPLFASDLSFGARDAPDREDAGVLAIPRPSPSPGEPPLALPRAADDRSGSPANSTAESDDATSLPRPPIAPDTARPLVVDQPLPPEALPAAASPPTFSPPASEARTPQRAARRSALVHSALPQIADRPDEASLVSAPLVSPGHDQTVGQNHMAASADPWRLTTRREEPAVNVTIGRVEVRAVFPSSQPARPPAQPAPALTIEEYARQRREGLR